MSYSHALTGQKEGSHMSTSSQYDAVLAAGGNPTGVICYPDASQRAEYGEIADLAMKAEKDAKVPQAIEQFGFLEGTTHFQMSAGEFCGNAARVAAFLLAEKTGKMKGTFTISGFSGTVEYVVEGDTVRCTFPHYPFTTKQVNVLGVEATFVDLGGIVHVVLPPTVAFRDDEAYYEPAHNEVTAALQLQDKAAVGVIWQEAHGNEVKIRPVVRVKGDKVATFYYETSCGSGTLATLITHNASTLNIIQPTDQAILAERTDGNTLSITSTVERRKKAA